MADLIDIAIKEIGYKEGSGNKTKYGAYTGCNGQAWCHSFVSWCAHKSSIKSGLVPKTASTTTGMNWYKNKKRFKKKGTYIPKRNDIVYFKTGRSHAGIVEYVKNGRLHTVEGNSSNMVKRREYSLSEHTITGYGVVSKYIDPDVKSTASGKSELEFINKMLDKQASTNIGSRLDTYRITSVDPHNHTTVYMQVKHGSTYYQIPVENGLKVEWTRKNTPGKMTFVTTSKNIACGDQVALKVNTTPFFFGFVFQLNPKNTGEMEVIVYDQLRYFKNKDSFFYKKKTATSMLRKIAKSFKLKTGTLTNTKALVTRIEQNKTLFDVMENCLDETVYTTGKIYTIYDNYGKLMLREPWKVNILIDSETGQGYSYSVSIDKDYYNQVKLFYENKSKGTLDTYVTKSAKPQNKYGVLQFYEKIDTPKIAKLKGRMLLQMYNKVARTLSIEGAFGSVKVRAGCLLPVMLTLYDKKVCSYLLVDKVTHKFDNGMHTMDLDLSGGGFDGE